MPTTTDDGLTISEWVAKAKNYRFSAHTFSAAIGVLAITYASNIPLQDAVKGFLGHHAIIASLVASMTVIYARYAPSKRLATITTTIAPGETGIQSAEATAGTEPK